MRGYNIPPWTPGSGFRRSIDGVAASEMRVSDAERRVIADALSQHFADGRLDQVEFDDRVSRALAAKTRGDLDGLLRDLPPLSPPPPERPPARRRRSRATHVLVAALALFMLSNSWSWALGWRGWDWGWGGRPHLGLTILLIVGVILLARRRGSRRYPHYREPTN